jgi:hypothetical protein
MTDSSANVSGQDFALNFPLAGMGGKDQNEEDF